MIMNPLDPTQYVPTDYPGVAELRSQGCPVIPTRRPRVDYTREFFCSKWGSSFNCICPPKQKTYSPPPNTLRLQRGVGKEMASFNYFSAPSVKVEGSDLKPKVSRAENQGLIFNELEMKCNCPEKSDRLPRAPNTDDFQGFDISSDLPFRVCFTEYPSQSEVKVRTGVDQCLRPSRYQNFNSCYNENFIDFFKTKTAKELSLYRTPLVIDHRRARPSIPFDPNPGLVLGVNSGPVDVNARPIGWKSKPKPRNCFADIQPQKPDFEVVVSGPIIVPTDYEW